MYEVLIAHLRECAKYDKSENTYKEAADAIERLKCFNALWQEAAKIAHEREPKWIPVTERLPEKPYGCMVIVWDNPYGGGDPFLNYYPEYIGFDGESWNDGDGEKIPFEVVYWMKMPEIPEPPKEKK